MGSASERFLEWAQIDLVCPSRAWLAVDLPIGLGDRVDAKQAILAALLEEVRRAPEQPLPIDAAVDHDMGNMQPLGPELARHRLCEHTQPRLGRSTLQIERASCSDRSRSE